jgi:hypothetical protein
MKTFIAKLRDATKEARIFYIQANSFGLVLVEDQRQATSSSDPAEAWKWAEIASQQFGMAFIAEEIPVRQFRRPKAKPFRSKAKQPPPINYKERAWKIIEIRYLRPARSGMSYRGATPYELFRLVDIMTAEFSVREIWEQPEECFQRSLHTVRQINRLSRSQPEPELQRA